MELCELDGYQYAYNPPKNQNPAVKAVATTECLGGRYYTVWGTQASRREITQTWPVLNATIFDTLKAKSLLEGTLSFTDDDGTQYTVIALPPTYEDQLPGGVAYEGVTFKLLVVSSP